MITTETATHTPGPWRKRVTGEGGPANSIRDAHGDIIATYQGHWGVTWEEREAEAEANGNLIARAPSLLAVAEAMIGSFSWLLDEASDAHGKCNLSDDTECREGSRPPDHEEIRDAYLLRREIEATIAQAREGGAS